MKKNVPMSKQRIQGSEKQAMDEYGLKGWKNLDKVAHKAIKKLLNKPIG
jgi:hypothetical protein